MAGLLTLTTRVVWARDTVALGFPQRLGEREGTNAEGIVRQTGLLGASAPAWRTVRAEEQDRNREKPTLEVMIAEERPASVQAIKMSHGHPRDHPSELGGLVMGGKH